MTSWMVLETYCYCDLRKYLSWTEHCPAGFSSLFISVTKRKKQVSHDTILFWIRLVICHAYESASYYECRLVRVMAHGVRKIAISLLFRRNYNSPVSIEGWNLVISEHPLNLLPLRCHPQAYGDLFHWPCDGGSRGFVAH